MTLQRRTWVIGTVTILLFAVLSLRMVSWNLLRNPTPWHAEGNPLREDGNLADPGGVLTPGGQDDMSPAQIQRAVQRLETITRGTIYDRNGRALAYEPLPDTGTVRVYTEPSLAQTVGYVSGLRLGVTGIEASYNDALLGIDRLGSWVDEQLRRPITGSDVYLTVDSYVQRVAARALGDRAGAVVALDAQTGAVLAMVSSPRFQPNRILEQDYVQGLIQACDGPPACRNPFLNRATQGLYTPGSTWKTVTLAAALDTGQVTPQTVFDFGEPRHYADSRIYYVYPVDGFLVEDPNHTERKLDLQGAFVHSANAAFARLADEMDPATFVEYGRRFGFSRDGDQFPPIEIAAAPSRLARDPDGLYTDEVLRASTGFGQGELQATPLGMALVVAGVVNDGDIPRPHLVQAVRAPSGRLLAGEPRGTWIRNALGTATAQTVRDMMIAVVKEGSGAQAAVPGAVVGGKTGTAQVGGQAAPHAWFVGFAREGNQAVAIAVLVENGGSGSQVAAPIFRQVAEAALRHLGERVKETVPAP
jgi:peptidoglycan glycosyltransferase